MAAISPSCQLCLQLPSQASDKVEKILADSVASFDIAAVVMTGGEGQPIELDWAKAMMRIAQARETAFLLDDIGAAAALQADGVHILAERQLYLEARERLGESAIVGVQYDRSRHDVMALAEIGADYVAFSAAMQSRTGSDDFSTDLITWWSETFIVPCVAWDISTGDEARHAVGAGADFISLSEKAVQNSDAQDFLRELQTLIGTAR